MSFEFEARARGQMELPHTGLHASPPTRESPHTRVFPKKRPRPRGGTYRHRFRNGRRHTRRARVATVRPTSTRRSAARDERRGRFALRSSSRNPTTPAFSPRTRGTRPASDVPSRAFAAERLTERHGRGRHGRRRPDGHATRHRDAPGHSGTTAFLSRPVLFPPPPSSSPPAPMLTRSPPSFPLFFSRA